MSGDQIPSLPGKKRGQIPGVCLGGGRGMLKLLFDWYITDPIHQGQTKLYILMSFWPSLYTVEPRFNEPPFNKVPDITNDILRPG